MKTVPLKQSSLNEDCSCWNEEGRQEEGKQEPAFENEEGRQSSRPRKTPSQGASIQQWSSSWPQLEEESCRSVRKNVVLTGRFLIHRRSWSFVPKNKDVCPGNVDAGENNRAVRQDGAAKVPDSADSSSSQLGTMLFVKACNEGKWIRWRTQWPSCSEFPFLDPFVQSLSSH